VGFAVFVLQPPLDQLPGGIVHHRNQLIARVKIASYNDHRSAPFSEPWSLALPNLLVRRSRQRHLINFTKAPVIFRDSATFQLTFARLLISYWRIAATAVPLFFDNLLLFRLVNLPTDPAGV
jgi:hypothetical protein